MKPVVLLAESDAALADIYRRFLARQDYEVETVSNGLECLAWLRCSLPDVLVLGLEMLWGGSDGVLACLREEGSSPGLPVVLTGTAGSASCLASVSKRFDVPYLQKPFPLTTLLEMVRFAAGKGSAGPLNNNGEPGVRSRSLASVEEGVAP